MYLCFVWLCDGYITYTGRHGTAVDRAVTKYVRHHELIVARQQEFTEVPNMKLGGRVIYIVHMTRSRLLTIMNCCYFH